MKRMLLEGPAVEPVPVVEAKTHLRLDGGEEDGLVGALIAAARIAVETEIRRGLISQKWRLWVERWPAPGIFLPLMPAISVDEIRGIDKAGNITVLDPADYKFERVDGSVRIMDPVPLPARAEIDFTAGYGTTGADVPEPLRQAIRLLVTHWYEHRSAVMSGEAVTAVPLGYRELVSPYRRLLLC